MSTACRFALLLILTFAQPGLAAAAAPPDPRFGIVESFVNPSAATEAGAGYTRIVLRWDVIQPSGRDDWQPANVPDPFIAAELSAGRQVVGLLIGTPTWAAVPGQTGAGARAVPQMFYWEAFVRRMAQHYRGRINTWIIWNEPDVWDAAHPGSTWVGSEADYFRLLKTAYLAIKGVDSSATVLMAGQTYFWDWSHGRRRYLDRLLDVIAADPDARANGYYFDAIPYHLYFNPYQTPGVLAEAKGALARRGITGKELWVNETNAPPSDDALEQPWSAPRYHITQAEQAAFVLQEFSLAFAAGAQRVEFYKLRNTSDHSESIEPFGLLRADDSRRPAFTAYRTATTYLAGFQAAYREQAGEVTVVTFDRRNATTTVLWTASRVPVVVAVQAVSPSGLLVDGAGAATAVEATGGVYMVTLPPATCVSEGCAIGGAPRLLVEPAAPRGRVALAARAPTRAAPRSRWSAE